MAHDIEDMIAQLPYAFDPVDMGEGTVITPEWSLSAEELRYAPWDMDLSVFSGLLRKGFSYEEIKVLNMEVTPEIMSVLLGGK